MAKTLVIAEKPSVGRDLAGALPGSFAKHEGYLESDQHVVTWAVGHLVQLAEPDEYDPKFKKWRMADLPIVPDEFRLVVRDERSKKQMSVITRQLKRDDVDVVVNACDAGREGELIFAWTFEKAGAKKPVQRLWLSSMTSKAIKEAFSALRPASEFELLEQAARSRSEADWIVGMNATRAATIRLRSSFDGAVSLGRVGPQQRATDTSMFMDAGRSERAPAGADGDLAALEVAEEFLPFGVGGGPVFVGGPQGAAAGEEGQMGLDRLVGVDGLVAEGDVDVAVAGDDLRDVRWQAVHDGIGDKDPSKVMRRVMQGASIGGIL